MAHYHWADKGKKEQAAEQNFAQGAYWAYWEDEEDGEGHKEKGKDAGEDGHALRVLIKKAV